jgi:AmmeMemoRadiSam system protein B
VISPHAGFVYSGHTSLNAVSAVRKNRLWIFGTSHYETIPDGIAIFPGGYSTSIGKTLFPLINEDEEKRLSKYISDRGHRKDEHSIENVLYAVNHFSDAPEAFCILTAINKKGKYEEISDIITGIWKENDSIIISTDWNHFRKVSEMNDLMQNVCSLLEKGELEELYKLCKKNVYEACGIDSLHLTYNILKKLGLNTKFHIREATNSSKVIPTSEDVCVGYIAANN